VKHDRPTRTNTPWQRLPIQTKDLWGVLFRTIIINMKKDNQRHTSGPGKTNTKGNTGAGTKKRRTEKDRQQERAKAAGVLGWEKMTLIELRRELKRIQSEGGTVPDLRQNNGGTVTMDRDKKVIEIKELVLMEDVEVVIHNRKTNQYKSEKKNALLATLQMLRSKALVEKDVSAAKEFLDRTLGKSRQSVEFSGEIKVEEQRLPTKAELAAAQAYEKALAEESDD